MTTANPPVRWARCVPQEKVRRLYANDAHGIVDAVLIDDVGIGMYLRCQSILRVIEADRGRVTCPGCETTIPRVSREKDEIIHCSDCGWETTWDAYHRTYKGKQLFGGGAVDAFALFVEQYNRAQTPRERLIAIDRLIHTFHWELTRNPTAPAARNLIEGSLSEVVAFLDTLTYGEQTVAEVQAMRARYRENYARSWVGGNIPEKTQRKVERKRQQTEQGTAE